MVGILPDLSLCFQCLEQCLAHNRYLVSIYSVGKFVKGMNDSWGKATKSYLNMA